MSRNSNVYCFGRVFLRPTCYLSAFLVGTTISHTLSEKIFYWQRKIITHVYSLKITYYSTGQPGIRSSISSISRIVSLRATITFW
jgi:hypothetical protein